ncbi:MAG TPA: hypothetical protein VMU29_08670 [Smithella sp.]|nr:hypothetical protein [Smithella sp.]
MRTTLEKRLKFTALLCVYLTIVLCCISCVKDYKGYYRYDNVTYDQPELALAAQKAKLDSITGEITPTAHPVGGSAVFIVPSVSYAAKNLVIWKGTNNNPDLKEKLIKFRADLIINYCRAKGEEIQKRRIFDRFVLTESDNPENAIFSEDVAIITMAKNGNAAFFVKKARANSSTQIEIDEDIPAVLPAVLREIWWLDKIEKISRQN